MGLILSRGVFFLARPKKKKGVTVERGSRDTPILWAYPTFEVFHPPAKNTIIR